MVLANMALPRYTVDMKRIYLTGKLGGYTLVDDEDFEWLNQWKWNHHPRHYATRSIWVRLSKGKFKHTSIKMHRLINKTPEGIETDHIDGNGLNNQKSNLRNSTRSQNCQNRRTPYNNKLGYTGIVWREKSRDYVAYINVNNKRIWLKTHKTLESAIKARKDAEIKYHKEFAYVCVA